MSKKKNFVIKVLCFPLVLIKYFFLYLIYYLIIIFSFPFTRCKVKGKENLKKQDEARVFICNHYEIYGPLAVYLNFPYKFRPWIIDKMMNEEDIEKQMGLMIYNNYKHVPKFIKKIIIKCVKSLVVFVMHHAKGISVSREDIRANLVTMKISSETLEKKQAIVIFPELWYKKEGVGEFQTGFEHIGKFHYQKTGKRISFYPMFISKRNKAMYIGNPLVFDPEKEANLQKKEIINYLHDTMVLQYETEEFSKLKKKNKKSYKKAQ